jgi:hypothetical protein
LEALVRLVDLDARFVVWRDGGFGHVDSAADAQGIVLEVCPGCGDHGLLVWFRDRGVPEAALPRPRWQASGTSCADLTLSPSINLVDDEGKTVACGWHGFIENGGVRDA